MARTYPWKVSDAFWEGVKPLLPATPSHAKGGRPRMDDRRAFEAIIYILRTGIQWNALPRELGASSTVHDRFQEWEQAGFFMALWQAGLCMYDELEGIQWEWQAVDGAMTKAPFGKAATGANPTDRGKRGVKRSLLTDGAGIPLAIVIDGANRHDVKLLCATLDGIVIARPEPAEEQPQHLCLDAGYVGAPARQEVETRHYVPHIRSRGEEKQEKVLTPGHRARRWVVERTHSWINRSRRLLVRWEKKGENYLAFLHLACAQLIFAKVEVFG
ncbi:IS5 family transposase [Ktedonobacter racemifer]|uniref:Transposase IS4 family protein n=1 Tax=Ktedonobacter racemifer DSM 44963 TaxID=485913 RepID=D6TVC1_KTERA|nr:IS5 family transposase [Ktedonobacter racemifer]EFH79532.1 transposase IS4 family protein [Ktedonobacter racemifer DSM 44963]EFH84221.1 transposase IS4 family protein [Ktedonobacter racemifer DSM 44963]